MRFADLVRMASKIAAMPDAVVLNRGAFHVWPEDIRDSNLDEEAKEAFQAALRQKESIQSSYRIFEKRGDTKQLDRCAFGKAPMVEALKKLMSIVEDRTGKLDPALPRALREIDGWEFPLEASEGWHVDLWVQNVHELITALFVDATEDVKTP